jgi:outer membrane protein, heavy metal efflux system
MRPVRIRCVASVGALVPVFQDLRGKLSRKIVRSQRRFLGCAGRKQVASILSAPTTGKRCAGKVSAFLLIVFSQSTASDAQTRRDSFVNPGQSGPQGIVGGAPGSSVGRTQPSMGGLPSVQFGPADPLNLVIPRERVARNLPLPLPRDLDQNGKPIRRPDIGKPGGITLDEAIEILLHNNLDLRQNRGDITQAEADYLTSSLRANPIAFVDTQGVPYGKYTNNTTGGPIQYDFNIVHSLDLSHKRQARMASASLNQRAVATKFQDLVRLAIDNLYTSYVDALVAQRNVDFLGSNDVLATVSRDDAEDVFEETFRTLSLQLNLPIEELKARRLFGKIAYVTDEEPVLPADDELVSMATTIRPDLLAQQIIVARSDADIVVARRSRFDDVLLLYQPYTFYTGIAGVAPQNSVAWSIGLTVPLPIYNRQQGNIIKAHSIASQARTQLESLERVVEADVRRAVRQVRQTRKAIDDEKLVAPQSDFIKKTLQKQINESNQPPDEKTASILLIRSVDKLIKDDEENRLTKFDEKVIQHRRSMLKLNTAVGRRILP